MSVLYERVKDIEERLDNVTHILTRNGRIKRKEVDNAYILEKIDIIIERLNRIEREIGLIQNNQDKS